MDGYPHVIDSSFHGERLHLTTRGVILLILLILLMLDGFLLKLGSIYTALLNSSNKVESS